MSDYTIYCAKNPEIDEIAASLKPLQFRREDLLGLSTFANRSAVDKRRYGGIDVCYSAWPPGEDCRIPARIDRPRSVLHITAGSKRPYDCLFTGIVAGVLAASYQGDVFDEEQAKILYQCPRGIAKAPRQEYLSDPMRSINSFLWAKAAHYMGSRK